MDDHITISSLNDFIFCPYSIYLHNVYMDTDEMMYHAVPQTRGRIAHESIDHKKAGNRREVVPSLPVYSTKYKLMGRVDLYHRKEKMLVERKYQLKRIYQGQIYQLWAQYLCLIEMGYEVEKLAIYEISTNRMIPVPIPDSTEIAKFEDFIKRFRQFDPRLQIPVNPNKCKHCIYSNLCDKTDYDNVYE